MNRRIFVCLLLALLAACGRAPTPDARAPVAASAPTVAPTSAPSPSPSEITQTALDMLAAGDKRGLESLYDPEGNDLMRSANARSAVNGWQSFNTGGPGQRSADELLRDVAIQPDQPGPNGLAVVPVLTTFANTSPLTDTTTVRWEFVFRATAPGWRVTTITITPLEAP